MQKFIEVHDKISGSDLLLNITHIAYIDLNTGQIMLDCSRALSVEKSTINKIKELIG